MKTHAPIIPHFDALLHGGDYNPDQWQHRPDIIQEDYRLQKLAGCNAFSVGIFAWTSYEPADGQYEFDWLDRTLDGLAAQGSRVFLATPSGGKPAWMSRKYPEIRRVAENGLRDTHKRRHNHCQSSPVYREKIAAINERLAERYAHHRALGGWHISNEYSGSCYCDGCLGAFRRWLEERYGSLDQLNRAWWTEFWSHRFTDFAEIDPRDESIDCLALDWKRFTTWITCDFMQHEIAAVRQHSDLPVTTNLMGYFDGLDYYRLAELCDFISDDNYPEWNGPDKAHIIQSVAMTHDQHRSMKQKPFVLIESTPSNTNWQSCMHHKRPGIHRLQMLQAIGHGADGAMYFQWRKGQGGFEKFHGAVVDHEGSENSRVFREVAEVGASLKQIAAARGGHVDAPAAIIYDWDARWGFELSAGPISGPKKQYVATCQAFHRPLWAGSVPVDVIESTACFDGYRLIIAPQLFMLKPGVADAMKRFVKAGGTLLMTTLSGIVNENNSCFLGGWPGDGLRELFGVWVEETDEFNDHHPVSMTFAAGNRLGLTGDFAMNANIDCVHAESAEVLATFKDGFYAGQPSFTVKESGKGRAYYLAGRCGEDALTAIVESICREAGVASCIPEKLPPGVVAQLRENESGRFYFLQNTTEQAQELQLAHAYVDLIAGDATGSVVQMPPMGSLVLKAKSD